MLRKILPAVLCIVLSAAAYAQSDTSSVTVQVITDTERETITVDTDGEVWQNTTRRKKVITNWFGGLDFGFANFVDNTDYASADAQAFAPGADADWFDLRNGKSVNVNLWIVGQKLSLINYTVNLKYALGLELNNYRYENPIRYKENPPYVMWDNTVGRTYTKNKLAADYVTIPVMLNFDFGKSRLKKNKTGGSIARYNSYYLKEWGFSAGVSFGYLYNARNKTITSDEGKQKLKDNFNLNTWKLSYVAEINLGYFSLYGSYAMKSMFKNGLDMTPYNVGIRF